MTEKNSFGPKCHGCVFFCSASNHDWLLLGDFNYLRAPDNRNKPGGCPNDMFTDRTILLHLAAITTKKRHIHDILGRTNFFLSYL